MTMPNNEPPKPIEEPKKDSTTVVKNVDDRDQLILQLQTNLSKREKEIQDKTTLITQLEEVVTTANKIKGKNGTLLDDVMEFIAPL